MGPDSPAQYRHLYFYTKALPTRLYCQSLKVFQLKVFKKFFLGFKYAQSHAVPWTQEYDQEQSYTRRLTHALLSWAETQRDCFERPFLGVPEKISPFSPQKISIYLPKFLIRPTSFFVLSLVLQFVSTHLLPNLNQN